LAWAAEVRNTPARTAEAINAARRVITMISSQKMKGR
jgi:hypothetical protein